MRITKVCRTPILVIFPPIVAFAEWRLQSTRHCLRPFQRRMGRCIFLILYYPRLQHSRSLLVFLLVPFLPVRDDFHPKRNQARQKLATLPKTRFKDLSGDVFYELGRRYPDFREPEVRIFFSFAPRRIYPRLGLSRRYKTLLHRAQTTMTWIFLLLTFLNPPRISLGPCQLTADMLAAVGVRVRILTEDQAKKAFADVQARTLTGAVEPKKERMALFGDQARTTLLVLLAGSHPRISCQI